MGEMTKVETMAIDPKQDIETGQKVAKALVALVKKHNWTANIQGKEYLQVEAWQTVGKFYGMTAKATEAEYVEYGTQRGFEAKADILNTEGVIIGGATAICMNDEPNWKNKPLYQLKSMAQTRAVSKAYRLILSWVVVLAGYQATPAEEMKGVRKYPETDKPQYAPGGKDKVDSDPEWIRKDNEAITTKQRNAIKMLQNQGKIDKKIKTTGMKRKEASELLSGVWGK